MKRRGFLGAALAATAWSARGAIAPRGQLEDFDLLWREIDAGYAYFEPAVRARWRNARERLRSLAGRAPSSDAFGSVIETAVAQLRDDNVTVSGAARASRRIPYELDIWPAWRDGAAVIEAVRTFGAADIAGLHAGQVVTRVQGIPVEASVREMLGGRPGNVADIEWALRRILAGPRVGVQRIEVRDGGRLVAVDVERTPPLPPASPPILARRMGEERDLAYIRVRIGAADPELATHFAGALGHMSGTRALILDLRESAGPGVRDATLAILARFCGDTAAWQVRQAAGKARVTDTVAPAQPSYRAAVAVLVDRWTAGEAEALAAGVAAVARAQVVGTPMAGLHGELREVPLPASGLVLRYPAERSFHALDGAPREQMKPTVPVDLAAPSGGPGDPILYQALKLFERR